VAAAAGLITRERQPRRTVSYTLPPPCRHLPVSQRYPARPGGDGLVVRLSCAHLVWPTRCTRLTPSDTAFSREHLFVLTEIDPLIHEQLMFNPLAVVDTSDYRPVYWFINGRTRRTPCSKLCALAAHPALQQHAAMHRRETADAHGRRRARPAPVPHPRNNFWLSPGWPVLEARRCRPDLAVSDFTLRTVPGETYDAIFEWTGKAWLDVYDTP